MLTYPLKGERVYSRHLGYRTGTKEQRKSQHHLRQWYLHSHRSPRGLSVYRPGQGDLTFSHHYVPLASSPTISYHTGVTHEYMQSAPDKPSSNQCQHHNLLEHVHPVGNLLYPPPVLRLLYNTPFNTNYRVREAKSLSPGRGVCVGGEGTHNIAHHSRMTIDIVSLQSRDGRSRGKWALPKHWIKKEAPTYLLLLVRDFDRHHSFVRSLVLHKPLKALLHELHLGWSFRLIGIQGGARGWGTKNLKIAPIEDY